MALALKRRSKHRKKKKSILSKSFKWAKSNPTKVIGILCGFVLIYITFLFIKEGIANASHSYQRWEIQPKK
jgi:hypothetical protein